MNNIDLLVVTNIYQEERENKIKKKKQMKCK
jgi:hypothetical protein